MSEKTKIYILFFLSGISGLIYETVWLRVLIRILGSTVYATSVVLAAFMAGLALGSWALGRWSQRGHNLLRLYAYLELGVGLSAVALMHVLNRLAPLYRAVFALTGGHRFELTMVQSVMLFLILLAPTVLMGGTLPVLTAHTRKYRLGLTSRIGNLYGLNTLGAVVGVLGSGIWSIGQIGELRTVLIGVAVNFIIALLALITARHPSGADSTDPGIPDPADGQRAPSQYDRGLRRVVLFCYAASGFIAISYEVVWTRIFQVQLGTSIYAFSAMLSSYLLGMALGSLTASRWRARWHDPLPLLIVAQVLIALLGLAGMYALPLFPSVALFSVLRLRDLLLLPVLIITPLTFLLGLLFPMVSRIYIADEERAGQGVGALYAANTMGCIAGSLATGFVLMGLLGTRGTMLLLAAGNLLIAAVLVAGVTPALLRRKLMAFLALAALAVVALGMAAPDPVMASTLRSIRAQWGDQGAHPAVLYHHESAAATTTAFTINDTPQGKQLWINGVGMTVLCTETKLMAHLPLLLHPDPRKALVICFGMGTALRSVWTHAQVSCDVVEIVPDAYECFKYFHANGPQILADPRVHHFADDGRNFLLMQQQRYDVITMDPAPPLFSAGTVNLYSLEYFTLCRAHLNPGGIMCLWIPPDRCSEVRMIMKSFALVFPECLVWGGPQFHGLYLTGFNGPAAVPIANFLAADRDSALVADLNEWDHNVPRPSAMLGLLALNQPQLVALVDGVPAVTDDWPATEFPLWRSITDPTYGWVLDAVGVAAWRNRNFGGKGGADVR